MSTRANLYLGFDFGAGSGRAVLGELRGGRLRLREIHRFPNQPVALGGRLCWDLLALWSNTLDSLRLCARAGHRLAGIGVDTWGVDFGLIGRDGDLLANPVCYRDSATAGIERVMARRFSPRAFYARCGQNFSRISTLAQLLALQRSRSRDLLAAADCLLFMPDLLRYFLCGQRAAERTSAGSSLLADIHTGRWSRQIRRAYGLPTHLFAPLVRAGQIAGRLRPDVSAATGLGRVPVAVVAGHDTASAAAAAPLADADTVFLSSGTWSVFGVMPDRPLISETARQAGFINETGFDSVLVVKNLTGLYLVENLKRQWARRDRAVTYAEMIGAARRATPFQFAVDMNAPLFFATEDVEVAAGRFLRASGQRGTPTAGGLVRTLLEALAFSYRQALAELEQITGRTFRRISLVGGGVRNELLCQFTADATGLAVVAGPVEATVIGNLALQALAAGQLRGAAAIRELAARSCRLVTYRPQRPERWVEPYARYQEVRRVK